MVSFYSFSTNRQAQGFTLIELIVVIILIGILAVTVIPKFLNSKGFEEYTYRDELITKLRSIQLRGMQQTTNGKCRQITASSSSIGLLATTLNATTCEVGLAGDSTTVTITPNHSVSFTVSENLSNFSFSTLGKPLGCAVQDPCKITIDVKGENPTPLQVEINEEGYIYAL